MPEHQPNSYSQPKTPAQLKQQMDKHYAHYLEVVAQLHNPDLILGPMQVEHLERLKRRYYENYNRLRIKYDNLEPEVTRLLDNYRTTSEGSYIFIDYQEVKARLDQLELSPEQTLFLKLIANGLTDEEIMKELQVTENTINTKTNRIKQRMLQKLGFRTKTREGILEYILFGEEVATHQFVQHLYRGLFE